MQRYSAKELQNLLSIEDAAGLRDVIDDLCDAKILRTIRADATKEEIDDEEHDDPRNRQHLESYTYRFHYVGILQYHQSLLYVLPKYCNEIAPDPEKAAVIEYKEGDEDPRMKPFQQVMQVIARYDDTKRELGEEEDEQLWEDSLHVMVELVSDYVENGVYRDDEHVDEINGKGRILWQRTIQKTLPFIQDGEPIYMELHTRRKREDDQNFFTRMHHYLAHQAWSALHTVRLDSLLSLPDIPAPEDSDSDFSEKEYMLDSIHAGLSQQFDSRRRYLLQLMERFLDRKEETFSNGFHTFGKTEFHTVWEEACRAAFGMEKSTTSMMEASKPHWQFVGAPNVFHGSALEADMVKVDGRKLTILDAKYYVPDSSKTAKEIVAAMPGIGDIIKQQLYELALRKTLTEDETKVKVANAFILPLRDDEKAVGEVSLGKVEIPMLAGLGLAPVELVKYPPQTIWGAYLDHVPINIPGM
ncbi:MAG: LlaJI family restriction endonuclease [Akkermansia sp.]|nr:LlaJI family restriction endonuclease [Akkermansia sp.]